MWTNRAALALVVLASAGTIPATAQSLAWQSRVTTEVPSGEDVSMANAALDGSSTSPVVALVTYDSESVESSRYRAIATDPTSGASLWSRDLGAACETGDSDYSLVVPLPGGDVVVIAQAVVSSILRLGSTCVQRLQAGDGHVLWSRSLSAPGSLLYIYTLVVDTDGQLLGGGRRGSNAYSLRLDTQTGQTLWEREIPAPPGYSSRVIAAVSGSNDSAVLHVLDQIQPDSASLRLLGIGTSSGDQHWSLTHCDGGVTVAYQRTSNEVRLRMLADASVEYASSCMDGSERTVELGRLNAATGAVIWQRQLSASNLYRAVIDSVGNLLLEGTLLIDSNQVGIARLDPVDGSLQWSLPQPAVPPGLPPYVSNRFVATDAYVHVLEMNVEYFDYVTSATVATYASTTGEFLGRFDAGFPSDQLVVPRTVTMRTLDNGEILIGALSGQNRSVGSRFFETRLQVVPGLSVWSKQIPVMAPHPLIPAEAYQTNHQMAWNGKGEPGVLLGGRGINNSGYDYPRAAKVSASDGRVLWRWETDRRVRGNVASVMSDSQGNVIVAGTNGWDAPPLLLAKLDGASGTPIWEASALEQRPVLDAVLGGDGNVLLVLGADDADPDGLIHVAKYSATDASPIWSVPVAQTHEGEVGEQRIAAHVDGSILVLSRFVDAGLGQSGMQVARLGSNDGALSWRRRLPGATSSPGIALLSLPNADVIVADSNLIWRLDGSTGTVEWQKTMPYSMWSLILDGQGQILASGSQANLRTVSRLNSSNGTALWTRQLPISGTHSSGERASVLSLSADGNIFVGGGDGNGNDTLAKITMLNGATIWQVATATSNQSVGSTIFPVGIVEAPDRNVFFSGLALPDPLSWTLDKVTGPFADGIFASGYE